jgi:hypothetical protein
MISMLTVIALASEDAREHGHSLFGEGVWRIASAAAALVCGARLAPQSRELVLGQLEHEIGREAVYVPANGSGQSFGLAPVAFTTSVEVTRIQRP